MNRRSVELLWLLVLAALAVVAGILLFSGDISLYISPRMLPSVWFGFAMLSILAVFQLVRLVRARREDFGKGTRLYSLMFLIPLILFVTVTPDQNTAMTLTNPGVTIVGAAQTDTQTPLPSPSPAATPERSAAPEATPEVTPVPTPAPEVTPVDVASLVPCVLTEDDGELPADTFGEYIYTPLEELQDQRVTLYGFVYKDDAFPEGTLLISRLLMTCCAADTSLVGFHVCVADAGDFENDEWIEVTGTVRAFTIEYQGEVYTMPILTDGTVVRRSAPTGDPYVYPY
jgi:putative membrane protein